MTQQILSRLFSQPHTKEKKQSGYTRLGVALSRFQCGQRFVRPVPAAVWINVLSLAECGLKFSKGSIVYLSVISHCSRPLK